MSANTNLIIKDCLEEARQQLHSQGDIAKLESEVLLAFVLNKPRSYLYTWPEQVLNSTQLEHFRELVKRRIDGEPIAYITGVKEFWGLPLKVTPDTLIPRPETERLVEIVLQLIPENTPFRVADLGTGSGAIALAIASERPNISIEATDVSDAALAVATENQSALQISNVQFRSGRWLEAFSDASFNIIISNPPYVAEGDPHLQQGDLRFEPQQALSSGVDGLTDIREIIQSARDHLIDGAYLLLEHGFDQADAVIDLFEKSGYSEVRCFRDYAERERATIGRWLT
ncbi:peptide chain release factor N(5)-glutamine methyltransferase [Kaarinaea lacus]